VEQGIIWDLDGVIVDSAPFHFQAWRKFTATKGKVFTQENFRRIFGMRNEDILVYIFGEKLEKRLLKTWSEEKEERFRRLIQDKVKPFPAPCRGLQTGRCLFYTLEKYPPNPECPHNP
jgi:beta-phosphoglucomutase-like phosphatase (HAD superfamily)